MQSCWTMRLSLLWNSWTLFLSAWMAIGEWEHEYSWGWIINVHIWLRCSNIWPFFQVHFQLFPYSWRTHWHFGEVFRQKAHYCHQVSFILIPYDFISVVMIDSDLKGISVDCVRNGRYFVMDMYAQSKSKKKTLLNIKEIKQQLMSVSEMAES